MKFFKRKTEPQEEQQNGKERKFDGEAFSRVMNGEILISDGMRKHFPYIFFCFILAMAYINNSYTYEQNISERQKLQEIATDMKYRHTDIQAKLTTKGQRNQLLQNLEELGSTVGNAQTQPIIIKK
mgnify:CR=1 FL=1